MTDLLVGTRKGLFPVTRSGGAYALGAPDFLGVPVTAVLLRRVPLLRLASHTFLASTYGGILGFAASLPFAQPRPSIGFMVAGSLLGFAAAALRLYLQHRANPVGEPVDDRRLAR
jgi:hypothetical protein